MPPTRLRVFVSSVQKEFEKVRADLKDFLLGDATLRLFVAEVFLFENLPAMDQNADQIYLAEAARCDIYLGLFGYEYGSEDAAGISPTEREFDEATRLGRTRLIYVWGDDEGRRAPKMKALIARASGGLIRRRVKDGSALNAEVYSSLVDFLDRSGALRTPPFDAAPCEGATVESLSRMRLEWFVATARAERGFPLQADTDTRAVLAHLNLLSAEAPRNAAVLLFGAEPQVHHTTAETKCVHCHGTEYVRPFGSQQNYGGDIFAQADQARDFVLAKIDRRVGTRSEGNQAPVTYELPPEAISEAIINALAHRDYHSNGSVEVRLFSDRLEVWNPGRLPATLSFADLTRSHASVPNNPLLADPLYLAHYIEKLGSGTQKMIELCRAAGLPSPNFEQRSGFFVTTIWRDWLTPEKISQLALNTRQVKAIERLRQRRQITNAEYQEATGATRPTAKRDLEDLVGKGLLVAKGRGRGAHYEVREKRFKNGPNGSSGESDANGS